MAEPVERSARGAALFTIPAHVPFVDALADGLIERTRDQPFELARSMILLPNRRATRALAEAFVRVSGGRGLLLPRLVPLGDLDETDATDSLPEELALSSDLRPSVDPRLRRLFLAERLRGLGGSRSAAEAARLAADLGRVLDQLQAEEVDAARLSDVVPDELAGHWAATLAFLQLLVDVWPDELEKRGLVDGGVRRAELFRRLARQWRETPPPALVVAAGLTAASPAAARLLATIASLPRGMLVFPGLDLDMEEAEWAALRLADPLSDPPVLADQEAHPQFALKLLLERIGVARGEVGTWPHGGSAGASPAGAAAARCRRVADAMAPARFTDRWQRMRAEPLDGVTLVEAASPAEEARVIAVALRQTLETPGRTAALVTPDRKLAARVSAQLARWKVAIDDSAGTPLGRTPPGTFVAALLEAGARGFTPVPLLALLKHPLVDGGGDRLAWLDEVRRLDLALRGLRPPPGLAGTGKRLRDLAEAKAPPAGGEDGGGRDLGCWWQGVSQRLAAWEQLCGSRSVHLAALLAGIERVAAELVGEAIWRGPAGRALAAFLDGLAAAAGELGPMEPGDAGALLVSLMNEVAVRPPQGGHPRLAIYGLLEARLQSADLVVLGGLNEGVWPAAEAPDPWLAPSVRRLLGLPGLERRTGLAAHDFVQALGAPRVLLTRAARDESAPTVPSRLLLRLQAVGDVERDHRLLALARALDRPAEVKPAPRPAPRPPAALRPRRLSVTEADMLRADPFSFYARRMLGLAALDPLDADPTGSERGSFVHEVLERWLRECPDGDPAPLAAILAAEQQRWQVHPLTQALWLPRVRRMLDWSAERLAERRREGWARSRVEVKGERVLANGIALRGRADRIDLGPGGVLAITDYKTGRCPSYRQVTAGYALQLGLLAAMAEDGALEGIPPAEVTAIRYWKLSGGREPGEELNPLQHRRNELPVADFTARCRAHLDRLCADLLIGEAPFTAKLHPDYSALYREFDQLARVAEWQDRPEPDMAGSAA